MSEADFALCLAKERARAERDGTKFLLVVIELDAGREGARQAQALAALDAVLGERTRLQDTRGRYKGKVGLILTGAAPDMLLAFWAEVEHRFRLGWRKKQGQQLPFPRLSYEAYVYPGDSQTSVNTGAPEPRNGRQTAPEGHRSVGK